MREQPPVLTLKNNYDSLLAALIGAAFIFTLTSYHCIGMSPDSVSYAGVASNICRGNGLTEFNDTPLIIFPAGYPSFLAVFSFLFNADIQSIAPWLNGFLIGLVIFITGCIVQQLNNRWYKLGILSILPFCFCLLDVYTMLWSETFFILLAYFFIVFLKEYLLSPTLKNLLIPALITAVACDTRIAGISVLATGLLLIFIHRKILWDKKLMHLVVYASVGILLLLINLIRNQHENGTFTGVRQKSITPLWLNIQYFGETVLQWFQLPSNSPVISLATGILVLLSLVGLFIYHYIKQKHRVTFEVINITFALVYILFIIETSTISKYERINNRLLSPAFIPLLVGISFWIPTFISSIKKNIYKLIFITLFSIVFILFQIKQVAAAIDLHNQIKDAGIPGYTELDWQESDIVQFLEKKQAFFKQQYDIYSNANDAVYFYSKLPTNRLPEPAQKQDLEDYYDEDPHYVVWFTNDFYNPAIISLQEMEKHRHLDTLAKFDDAVIFWSIKKK